MLTIWGRATSLNVQAVMWTAAELDLPHRRVDWGGRFGGNDDIDYRAMNPNGLIPTLRDSAGDVVVWESPAIVRYLGARYGRGTFWPEDPAVRAPLDMWAEWARSSVYPELTRIFVQLVRTREAERSMTDVAAAGEALIALLPRLEARLAAAAVPWLGGDQLSFADVMVGHLLYRYMTLNFAKAPTPAIDGWYARLNERPAYREHVMVSYESLRPD